VWARVGFKGRFVRKKDFQYTHVAMPLNSLHRTRTLPDDGSGASGDFGPEKARSRAEDRQTAKHICFNSSRFQSLTRSTREASAAHIRTVVRRCTRTAIGIRRYGKLTKSI
jgi:hypothetical protein